MHRLRIRQRCLGPDQRTAIKARGSYDPHYEAGQMTATTKCCNVEIVLAMWVSSTDAQVCKNFCWPFVWYFVWSLDGICWPTKGAEWSRVAFLIALQCGRTYGRA